MTGRSGGWENRRGLCADRAPGFVIGKWQLVICNWEKTIVAARRWLPFGLGQCGAGFFELLGSSEEEDSVVGEEFFVGIGVDGRNTPALDCNDGRSCLGPQSKFANQTSCSSGTCFDCHGSQLSL